MKDTAARPVKRLWLIATAITSLVLSPSFAAAQEAPLTFRRQYALGETFRYRIVQTEVRSGAISRTEAVSHHEVVNLDGALVEEVRWSMDGELSPAALAAKSFPAYYLSLSEGGTLESPRPLNSVTLLGLVTDLQTFYVAVSPGLGAGELSAAQTSFVRPQLVVGDFADGAAILSGQDCTRATLRVLSVDAAEVSIETRFDPPQESCLSVSSESTSDAPYNFQMVRRADDRVLDLIGHESFVIVTKVSRTNGQILSAEMINLLSLRGRSCSDETLSECAALPPIERHRTVALELMPNNETS